MTLFVPCEQKTHAKHPALRRKYSILRNSQKYNNNQQAFSDVCHSDWATYCSLKIKCQQEKNLTVQAKIILIK